VPETPQEMQIPCDAFSATSAGRLRLSHELCVFCNDSLSSPFCTRLDESTAATRPVASYRLGRFLKVPAYLVSPSISLVGVFPFIWMLTSILKPFEKFLAGTTFCLKTRPRPKFTSRSLPKTTRCSKLQNSFSHRSRTVLFYPGASWLRLRQVPLSRQRCAAAGAGLPTFTIPFSRCLLVPFCDDATPSTGSTVPCRSSSQGSQCLRVFFFMYQYMLSVQDDMLDRRPHRRGPGVRYFRVADYRSRPCQLFRHHFLHSLLERLLAHCGVLRSRYRRFPRCPPSSGNVRRDAIRPSSHLWRVPS